MATVRIESRIIDWAATDDEKTIVFATLFEDIPVVCVLPYVNGSDGANVNTYISQVSKTSVVVGSTARFEGKMHLQAVDKTW